MYKKPSGPGDNKSYKDMYPFNMSKYFSNNKENMSSINVDPDINSTIKENPYRSNVEIEKDEVILQPDLSALFKAKGKTHKQGGIDVSLKPDSFVFSNDPTLAFNEGDHKMFEFKEGGTFKKDKNTPADVLKRNIDVKHYNRMVANITDIKKDDLAKKSSSMMLEKYINTLGNIAFLQEQKKQFPQGIPPFAENTAPVYNSNLKENIMEQKQYAKYGGTINGKMPLGGIPCPCGKDPDGKCLPCPPEVYQGLIPGARKVNQILPGYDPLYTDPKTGTQLAGKFGTNPPQATKFMKNSDWLNFLSNETPAHKAQRLARPGSDTEDYIRIDPTQRDRITITPPQPSEWQQPAPPPTVPITPGQVSGGQNPIQANWEFTPWQKMSQAYSASKYAGLHRYMPYRSHMNSSYVDPQLVNPEQTVGDMKGALNQNLASANVLNPILRNAQASSAYGQFLDREPSVRSQYDNQSIGITNQFRQYNNQIRNNETAQNMQNDQQYYQQSVVGRQNFDNMKGFLGDQYMNNLLGDVQDNQSLSYNLLTQKNPAYGFDFKSGNFYRNQKDIRDVQMDPKSDFYTQLAGKLMEKLNRGETLTKSEVDFFKGLSISKLPFSSPT